MVKLKRQFSSSRFDSEKYEQILKKIYDELISISTCPLNSASPSHSIDFDSPEVGLAWIFKKKNPHAVSVRSGCQEELNLFSEKENYFISKIFRRRLFWLQWPRFRNIRWYFESKSPDLLFPSQIMFCNFHSWFFNSLHIFYFLNWNRSFQYCFSGKLHISSNNRGALDA